MSVPGSATAYIRHKHSRQIELESHIGELLWIVNWLERVWFGLATFMGGALLYTYFWSQSGVLDRTLTPAFIIFVIVLGITSITQESVLDHQQELNVLLEAQLTGQAEQLEAATAMLAEANAELGRLRRNPQP